METAAESKVYLVFWMNIILLYYYFKWIK
jgi:hypothetical protein